MPGRFFLGVGTGENLNEHVARRGWPSADVRLEMLEEAIERHPPACGRASSSATAALTTRSRTRASTPCRDEPPPIMVAASETGAAELAGKARRRFRRHGARRGADRAFREAGGRGSRAIGQLTVCYAASDERRHGAPRTSGGRTPRSAASSARSCRCRRHFEQAAELLTEDQVAEAVVCGPDPKRHREAIDEYVAGGLRPRLRAPGRPRPGRLLHLLRARGATRSRLRRRPPGSVGLGESGAGAARSLRAAPAGGEDGRRLPGDTDRRNIRRTVPPMPCFAQADAGVGKRPVARFRRSDCSQPGISRRGRGRGFEYRDATGAPLRDPRAIERIRALAIPPAWADVWICPDPLGHLQATGVDSAGRKQYLYHEQWRARRDREKFDRMLAFAGRLSRLRRATTALLEGQDLTRERVLAGAVRLLDLGFFRIGSESYAEENETFGLATMRKTHVRLGPECALVFDYAAKGGHRRVQSVVDPAVYGLVDALKRRRNGHDSSPTGPPGAGSTSRPRISTTSSATGGRNRSRPRTFERGTPPSSPRRPSVSRAAPPGRRRAGSVPSPWPSTRSRAIWATRPPCAGPRTSTRGSSTASTRG